jgi:hypothetical protein
MVPPIGSGWYPYYAQKTGQLARDFFQIGGFLSGGGYPLSGNRPIGQNGHFP